MFEKGQIVKFKIEDMTGEGQGLGRADGLAVFVPGAVVGDEVTAELTKVKKNYAFSKLISIDSQSPDRCESMCGHAKNCGGCPLAELSYEGQLKMKERQVREKLARLGKLDNPTVRPIIGMDSSCGKPFRYRNKASFPVSTGGIITRKGGIVENLGECAVGFYRAKSHEVVDLADCNLQSEPAMAVADALRRYMKEDNITAWDPKWEKGLMRHLIVKTCFGTGQVMAVLVINGKGIPNAAKFIEYADDAVYETGFSLESVVLNFNTKKTQEIMGEECEVLAGKGTVTDVIGGLEFEISPMSFWQVNPVQMEKLYAKAREYAGLTGEENVLDVYCGTGSIGIYMAAEDESGACAKSVLGIESVKQAVLDANRNAVINGIVNARFICGKAEDVLPELVEDTAEDKKFDKELCETAKNADVVILDPPRAGCRPELLEAVVKVEPRRIVYVSCDPATLARDVKILGEWGYEFIEATPVDMFPESVHVESVVLLTKVHN